MTAIIQSIISGLSFVSKNIHITIYWTTTFTASYGREPWPLIRKEEGRMRVFEIRVITEMFGPKRKK
jgi:hypothetical protein